jgi:invasion protein IalB
MRPAIMLNKALIKQTLVAILLAAPGLADPPHARVPVRGFADWQLDCTAAPCVTRTSVAGADGSEVLRLTLSPGEPPLLAVSTPLALYLPDGVLLAVGAEPPVALVWRTCGPAGCEARLTLTPELAAALRRERQASVTFTPADGVPVRVRVSLIGYTAAGRALAARQEGLGSTEKR